MSFGGALRLLLGVAGSVGLAFLLTNGFSGDWLLHAITAAGAGIGGYFIIDDLFCAPLRNQIRGLEYKIDRLQRLVRPDLDYGDHR